MTYPDEERLLDLLWIGQRREPQGCFGVGEPIGKRPQHSDWLSLPWDAR